MPSAGPAARTGRWCSVRVGTLCTMGDHGRTPSVLTSLVCASHAILEAICRTRSNTKSMLAVEHVHSRCMQYCREKLLYTPSTTPLHQPYVVPRGLQSSTAIQPSTVYSYTALYSIQPLQHPSATNLRPAPPCASSSPSSPKSPPLAPTANSQYTTATDTTDPPTPPPAYVGKNSRATPAAHPTSVTPNLRATSPRVPPHSPLTSGAPSTSPTSKHGTTSPLDLASISNLALPSARPLAPTSQEHRE